MTDIEKGIQILLDYNKIDGHVDDYSFDTFRALMNITMPYGLDESFYELQDKIIQDEYKDRKIIHVDELSKLGKNIYLYQGDITSLDVDAIVNACNNKLLGCFVPLHRCIDNAIHSYAGLQVRRDLVAVMEEQVYDEPNGKVKVTNGYNLPSRYVFHTVGPIVYGRITERNIEDLSNCYLSCLRKAMEMNIKIIAFPCISTGEYHFDNAVACDIAYKTVSSFLNEHPESDLKVIFVTFKDIDQMLYKKKGENYDHKHRTKD